MQCENPSQNTETDFLRFILKFRWGFLFRCFFKDTVHKVTVGVPWEIKAIETVSNSSSQPCPRQRDKE